MAISIGHVTLMAIAGTAILTPSHPCNITVTIESIKTTSMENVSTGVLKRIKNYIWEVVIKPKNDMMYQDIYNCICQNTKKNILSIMSNLCLKVDFQKVDQHAGGKWLIHDTKRHNDNQLQSLKLPCRICCRISQLGSQMWHKVTMLNPIFWKKVQGQRRELIH